MTDWARWHEDYERPGSQLSRRLEVVKARLRTALDIAGPSPVVLSLCSGDGRDVIAVVRESPGRVGRAVLVENDPGLVELARRAAGRAGLSEVEVRCQDAGAVASFIDVLPVDILMLCGIFGNIEHAGVKTVVDRIPGLVKAGGSVIWTRGGSEPDRRQEIRAWFVSACMDELAFDGPPEPFGVGFNRVFAAARTTGPVPERLFAFTR